MTRLYRLLLYALPPDLRREFGADMAQLFADERRAAPTFRARALLTLAAAGDVLREAAAERRQQRPRASLSPRLLMRSILSDFRHGLRLLRRYPSTSLLAVATLHVGGFLFGYIMSRAVGGNIPTARTISIEVGMQNSGLGVVLARQNFANPLVAIPSAISSLFHSLIASLLAALWRARTKAL